MRRHFDLLRTAGGQSDGGVTCPFKTLIFTPETEASEFVLERQQYRQEDEKL